MESAERRGSLETAFASGLKLLSLDPLQESVHRALMRLYAAQGRPDAALAQYESCRRELSKQLGVRPECETESWPARSGGVAAREGGRHWRRRPQSRSRDAIMPTHAAEPAIDRRPAVHVGRRPTRRAPTLPKGWPTTSSPSLSRNRDLFVVARQSSFHIAQHESDPAAIGRALGVRHLLTGSVRRAGERLRLTLHLIECESGREAWSERYDRRLEDLFDVQLEVARTVTATIAGRLTALADDALATKPPANFAAYDHVLRAQQYLQRYTRADYARAREHLEAAIRADPSYARPYGLLCMAGVYDWFWEMSEDGLADVIRIGETALAMDDQDAKTHLALAVAHFFSWHHDRALHHIERAMALNPNDDLVAVEHARLLIGLDRPEDGLVRVREAMRLNPVPPELVLECRGFVPARRRPVRGGDRRLRPHRRATVLGRGLPRRVPRHVRQGRARRAPPRADCSPCVPISA